MQRVLSSIFIFAEKKMSGKVILKVCRSDIYTLWPVKGDRKPNVAMGMIIGASIQLGG